MADNQIYKVFTVRSGEVAVGASIEAVRLSGVQMTIPAILIGEEGRGRERGILPVALNGKPCPHRGVTFERGSASFRDGGCVLCATGLIDQGNHPDRGEVYPTSIVAASIGQTRAGRPKLFSAPADAPMSHDVAIVVFRTPIGYRGSSSHTGERGWTCASCTPEAKAWASGEPPQVCPACGAEKTDDAWSPRGPQVAFAPFPHVGILARGVIAQGDAGRMGSGEQFVALVPRDVVFRTGYSGRLYGNPTAHYYRFDGERIQSATWDERVASDVFWSAVCSHVRAYHLSTL